MRILLKLLLLSIFFPGLVFAGGIGSGGSPPSILLPRNQFTEMTLGVLRGEKISIHSEDADRVYEPVVVDTRSGSMTVTSLEDGSTVILQDFDKKFRHQVGTLKTTRDPSASGKEIQPNVTIPVNPDVKTVPKDTDEDSDISN